MVLVRWRHGTPAVSGSSYIDGVRGFQLYAIRGCRLHCVRVCELRSYYNLFSMSGVVCHVSNTRPTNLGWGQKNRKQSWTPAKWQVLKWSVIFALFWLNCRNNFHNAVIWTFVTLIPNGKKPSNAICFRKIFHKWRSTLLGRYPLWLQASSHLYLLHYLCNYVLSLWICYLSFWIWTERFWIWSLNIWIWCLYVFLN